MKIFKKLFACFAIFVSLFMALSFCACGKKKNTESNNPKPPEASIDDPMTTASLSFDEYNMFLLQHGHAFSNGFKATQTTTYSNEATETAEQYVYVNGTNISSSITVSGNSNFDAYFYGNYVYYSEGATKVFSPAEVVSSHSDYKTAMAYDYMMLPISPATIKTYSILDGSLFDSIREAYDLVKRPVVDENVEETSAVALTETEYNHLDRFEISKEYNQIKTNIKISYTVSSLTKTIYTLKFVSNSFVGAEIEIVTSQMTRVIVLEHYNLELEFPDFSSYVAETKKDDEFIDPDLEV